MTRHVTMQEFQDQLPALIEQVGQGDEIVIDQDGKAVARVVPVPEPVKTPRQPGSAKGLIHVHGDFNEPLPEDVLKDFGL